MHTRRITRTARRKNEPCTMNVYSTLTHTSRRERWRIFWVPRSLPLHATIKVLYCHKIGWKLWAGCATVASRQGRAFLIWGSWAIFFFRGVRKLFGLVSRGKNQGLRIWCWKHERLHNTYRPRQKIFAVRVVRSEPCFWMKTAVRSSDSLAGLL
jgi:hypothetical protein